MLSKFKLSGLIAVCLLSFNYAQAQHTEPLLLNLPKEKVAGSLYNKITLIDIRPDTIGMGIIQTGAFNRKAIVVAKEPLKLQLNNILAALIDNTAKQQELALQLQSVNFAEITGGFSEKGYFSLKAQLYVKTTDGYKRINAIDTVASVSSGMDVSNALLKKGSETLSNFIAASLKKQPSNYIYSYNDVENADSIEKSKTVVYNANALTDGLYLTYKTFSAQIPDMKITVVGGDSVQRNNVKIVNETGKFKKIKSGSCYAIVYKGKAYISTLSDYYILNKRNEDFFFTGSVQDVIQSNGNIAAMGMMYGAIGGALAGAISAASASDDSISEFKVNYQTGQFIKVKEIKKN